MKSIIPYLRFQISLFVWLLLNNNEYDICHLCDFDTAFVGSKACRLLKKKYVFDIFDYLSTDAKSRSQKWIKHREDRIIDESDATIICSEERKLQIKDGRPRKLVVIHNSPRKLNEVPISPQMDKVRIVYVGILQDYRMLLEVGEYLKQRNDLEFHIGGFGKYEDHFQKLSKENQNIIWHGKLSYEETLELENSCSIMLAIYDPKIGNHRFAAPNKFYESLMLGKPVIMVRGTGMSQYVEQYDIGEVIDYSVDGFECGLNNLLKRSGEWKAMAIRMRQLYQDNFSWDEMEKRLVSLYCDL